MAVFVDGAAGRAAAEHAWLRDGILERLDLRIPVGRADACAALGATEILEPDRLIRGFGLRIEQRRHDRAWIERADGGAVLGRHGINVRSRLHGAGAWHVADDDGRVAGDEARQMSREGARVEIVAAAGAAANHHADGLASVEVGGRSACRSQCNKWQD
jgi:hypothetical protein